jgi:hypothetical protein
VKKDGKTQKERTDERKTKKERKKERKKEIWIMKRCISSANKG